MRAHLLTLTPTSGETCVSLHTSGTLVASHVVHAETIQSLITRADDLLSRAGGLYPTRSDLIAFGRELAEALLGPIHPPLIALRGRLWIVSTEADLLNLPLELIPRDGGSFLIEGGHLLLRRTAEQAAATAVAVPVTRPGPLRVLFMACAPEGSDQLAYEVEQEAIERLCIQAGRGVHLDTEFSGTLAGLIRKIQTFRPHLVHLSGHASLEDNGMGHFLFEDEFGKADPVPAADITSQAFANFGVGMVFFSGCETARSGIAGVCQAVVNSGHVPLVLGWGLSVADDLATRFAASLLTSLAAGETVDIAMDRARTEILAVSVRRDEHGVEYLRTDFILPRLHAASAVETLHDPAAAEDRPKSTSFERRPLEDGITSLVEGFIGRRRILQRTFPVLRDGVGGQRALLLTGIGGAGKSSLASHIIDEFRTQPAWTIIALKLQEDESPFSFGARIARTVREAAQLIPGVNPLLIQQLGEDRTEPHPVEDLSRRLRFVVQTLNDHPFLLYLDNLESLMPVPPAEPVWSDPAFQQFFTTLVNRLTGKGRAILTCRYLPHGLNLNNAPHLLHERMPDFTLAEFNRYLFYDETIRSRILNGELPDDLIHDFHAKLGATPRFLDQTKAVLRRESAETIRKSLAKIGAEATAHTTDDTPDEILQIQQQYFADLFLPGLYQALTPTHRLALSTFAVSDLALPLDGLAAITGLPLAEAQVALAAWHRLGLVQCFDDRDGPALFSIYPLQRSFLTAPERLPAAEEKLAHQALSAWLKECSEADREAVLGMHFMAVFFACLNHARAATDYDLAKWAAIRIGSRLHRVSEFRTLLNLAEDLLREIRHPDFLKLAADASYSLSHWDKAQYLLEEAIPKFIELNDIDGHLIALHQLASIEVSKGEYDSARKKLEYLISAFQEPSRMAYKAAALHQLGSIDVNQGFYPSARIAFNEVLAIRRFLKDQTGIGNTLHQIGFIEFQEEEYSNSLTNYTIALQIRKADADRDGEAATLQGIGSIYLAQKDHATARRYFMEALAIEREIGKYNGEAASWHNLGTIDLRDSNYSSALGNFRVALQMRQKIGDIKGEAATWGQLAILSSNHNGLTSSCLHLALVASDILRRMNGAEQETVNANIFRMAAALSLTPDALEEEIQAALTSYQADGGAALLAAAFPQRRGCLKPHR